MSPWYPKVKTGLREGQPDRGGTPKAQRPVRLKECQRCEALVRGGLCWKCRGAV